MYSDSHTHLASWPAEQVPGLIKQAVKEGITVIQAWAENLDSAAVCIGYAEKNKGVYAGVGIHPWNAVVLTDDIKKQLEELARRRRVVAIGEVGLDYARNPNNWDVQKESLRYQVEFARIKGLPVDVHTREAHEDMMAILRPVVKAGLKGISHGFTGDVAQLKDWLNLDFYVSIGVRGFVTNELPHMIDVVKQIPEGRILAETDNGFTAEHPGLTGVIAVVEKMAKVRGSTPDEIGALTTANLKRILKIA
jgi:TatD DNase family protein